MEALKKKTYDLFEGNLTILELEKWVYENDLVLEKELPEEYYYELISFNYKSRYSRDDFFKKFEDYINWDELEEVKLRGILDSIINKDNDIIENLMKT